MLLLTSQRESARPHRRRERGRACSPAAALPARSGAVWRGGAGHAQPRAVPATACWIATASLPHQRLDHPAAAPVRRRAGPGARVLTRGPVQSAPPRHSSARRFRIPARGGVGVQLGAVQDRWRVCVVRPCGVLTRAGHSTGPLRVAWRRTPQGPSVVGRRADAGRHGVSQPLLRDDLAVRQPRARQALSTLFARLASRLVRGPAFPKTFTSARPVILSLYGCALLCAAKITTRGPVSGPQGQS